MSFPPLRSAVVVLLVVIYATVLTLHAQPAVASGSGFSKATNVSTPEPTSMPTPEPSSEMPTPEPNATNVSTPEPTSLMPTPTPAPQVIEKLEATLLPSTTEAEFKSNIKRVYGSDAEIRVLGRRLDSYGDTVITFIFTGTNAIKKQTAMVNKNQHDPASAEKELGILRMGAVQDKPSGGDPAKKIAIIAGAAATGVVVVVVAVIATVVVKKRLACRRRNVYKYDYHDYMALNEELPENYRV